MIYMCAQKHVAQVPGDEAIRFLAARSAQEQFLSTLISPAIADLIDAWFLVDPSVPWPKAIEHARRPTVVIVGDDPGASDGLGGPDAWRCVRRLRRWTRAAMIHGAGGQPEHYAEVTRAAMKVGRVALVESTSRHALAWRAAIGCPRSLLLIPREGLSHPLVQAEAAQ